jgi:hypothetical protein
LACESSADNSDRLPGFRAYHDQGSISIGPSNGYESAFLD